MYGSLKRWFIGDYLSEQTNIHNRARAALLFDTSALVFTIAVPFLIVAVSFGYYGKLVPTSVGISIVLLQLLYFRKYKKLWISAFMICFLSSAILTCSINFNTSTIHLVEPFWMIVIVVFAVFMLGVRWGIFFCVFLMTGFAFFVVNSLQDNLRIVMESIPSIKYFLIVEIGSALLSLVYILSIFVTTTRKSERALREGNERLEARNELVNRQNSEITILLKEIHHRVKNNLQVINSLLRLQSDQITDEASRNVFDDAQYRIRAIALIHEQMYKSADLSDIQPEHYFRGLAGDLLRQHVTNQSVRLQVTVAFSSWNHDKVVPLGLLLNELIANSVEHGKMGEAGEIRIRLEQKEAFLELEYADNGHGFGEEFRPGFGLELIETLTAQLNGRMERFSEKNSGVRYLFRFYDG